MPCTMRQTIMTGSDVASRNVTAGDLWPAITAAGLASRTRTESRSGGSPTGAPAGSAAGAGAASSKTQVDLFQAGFDASWEIDVFGGTRRAVEAAEATAEAARENYRDTLVTLLAEVARNYVELRGQQQRLAITQSNIATQQDTLELTRSRYASGLTSQADVLRSEAQLLSTQSQVPTLESSIKHSIHQLGVLLGREPGALLAELSPTGRIPPPPPEVPVGLPSDLLRRRPDVRSAERELAAATAQIGVAVANLFPRFSLTGSFGRQGQDLHDLKLGGNRFWQLGSAIPSAPAIQWPIFEGGKLLANIKVQDARQEQAVAQYEKTVLVSLEDVENSLVDYSHEQVREQSLDKAAEANSASLNLSKELYSKGLTDFLNVLDAQRSLFASQDSLVQSRQTVSVDLIALYKALGGGWQAYENNVTGTAAAK